MNVIIDFAYHNVILVEYNNSYKVIDNLYNLFIEYSECNFEFFIIYHPGSYTGIRKSVTLSILQSYISRITIFACNLIQYLHSLSYLSVGVVIGKHIWYSCNNIEKVLLLSNFHESLDICNIDLPNTKNVLSLTYDYIWQHRHEMFIAHHDFISPIYLDIFSYL